MNMAVPSPGVHHDGSRVRPAGQKLDEKSGASRFGRQDRIAAGVAPISMARS